MYFRLHGKATIVLMSLRPNSLYAERIEENGRVLIYEGQDILKRRGVNPKTVDQQMHNDSGTLSENGRFFEAARKHVAGDGPAEFVKVYEKIRPGVWVCNGTFRMVDAWREDSGGRKVFK